MCVELTEGFVLCCTSVIRVMHMLMLLTRCSACLSVCQRVCLQGFQQLKVLRSGRQVSCFVEFDTIENASQCHGTQQVRASGMCCYCGGVFAAPKRLVCSTPHTPQPCRRRHASFCASASAAAAPCYEACATSLLVNLSLSCVAACRVLCWPAVTVDPSASSSAKTRLARSVTRQGTWLTHASVAAAVCWRALPAMTLHRLLPWLVCEPGSVCLCSRGGLYIQVGLVGACVTVGRVLGVACMTVTLWRGSRGACGLRGKWHEAEPLHCA